MMSNVEIIKNFYDYFKKHDQSAYLQLCDDDIEWITMDGMPNGGKYVGKESVFNDYFPKMLANFEEFHAIPENFLDSRDRVIVIGRYQGTSKIGKKFDVPFSHVYTLENNLILRFMQFTDTEKIQNALKKYS